MTGSFSLNYGNAELVFNYWLDPAIPPTDYSYIIHHNGRVDVHESINATALNRVSLQRTILSQISIDELNPPLVIYVKVGNGERND